MRGEQRLIELLFGGMARDLAVAGEPHACEALEMIQDLVQHGGHQRPATEMCMNREMQQ
jgi:hypothetical protein